jgi:tetratricopeptide (TPR) repeat protein
MFNVFIFQGDFWAQFFPRFALMKYTKEYRNSHTESATHRIACFALMQAHHDLGNREEAKRFYHRARALSSSCVSGTEGVGLYKIALFELRALGDQVSANASARSAREMAQAHGATRVLALLAIDFPELGLG